MSSSTTADTALDRLRTAFDSAAEEAEQLSESAQTEITEAIDELKQSIEKFRD